MVFYCLCFLWWGPRVWNPFGKYRENREGKRRNYRRSRHLIFFVDFLVFVFFYFSFRFILFVFPTFEQGLSSSLVHSRCGLEVDVMVCFSSFSFLAGHVCFGKSLLDLVKAWRLGSWLLEEVPNVAEISRTAPICLVATLSLVDDGLTLEIALVLLHASLRLSFKLSIDRQGNVAQIMDLLIVLLLQLFWLAVRWRWLWKWPV